MHLLQPSDPRIITLSVVWPSGERVLTTAEIRSNQPLSRLRQRITRAAAKPIRALISPKAKFLDWTWTAAQCGLKQGDTLTLIASNSPRLYSTLEAFAAVLADGSVRTWGHKDSGGDSSAVQTKFKQDIQHIYSNDRAFAALMADGSVVTWGHEKGGGDSSDVQDELQEDVEDIYSTEGAFAALKRDGSVVTWGSQESGGDSSHVYHQLRAHVEHISSTVPGTILVSTSRALAF